MSEQSGSLNNEASVGQEEMLQRLGQLLERSNLQPGDVDRVQSLRVSDWEVVTKGDDGEPVINQLHGTQALLVPKSANAENPFITQASPTVINPSENKPVVRDHELIGVIPDIQYGFRQVGEVFEPLHDPRALEVARMVLADIRPDMILLQGDLLDFSEVSRYEADSPHFASTLQLSINGLHKYLAGLRADNPNARMVGLEGNHSARLAKAVLKHNAQLAGIKRANIPEEWNAISVPSLLRFDELGIEWYSGYPANEYRHTDNLTFVHGQAVKSGGSSAAKYSRDYPDTHVVFGHIHRSESQSRTDRNGNVFMAVSFGTLARIDGVVPSYHNGVDNKSVPVRHYENWSQAIGAISVYGDNDVEFHTIPIHNGKAKYLGKEYASR